MVWESAPPMGLRKSGKAGDGDFYGGTACWITGEGKVFGNFFRPSGDVLNEVTTNRDYPLEKQSRSVRQIDADDVTIAFEAQTGKELWRVEEKGAAMNFLSGKRGHYGVTPAYGDGKVFVWGALGNVYAYDAKTGQKIWQAEAENFHAQAKAAKAKALQSKAILSIYGGAPLFEHLRTGLVFAGGTVVTPDGLGGLLGFDPATGTPKWAVSGVVARGATPSTWRATNPDQEYLLCPADTRQGGKVSLIDPADGRVVWVKEMAGATHTSLVPSGDIVLLNTRGHPLERQPKDEPKNPRVGAGLFGAFEISRQGLKPLWTLDDTEENWHALRSDRGMNRRMAIRDGIAYALLGPDKLALTSMDL